MQQSSYGNGLSFETSITVHSLSYPQEVLPTLQPGALARAVSAQLTSLRHSPYEVAMALLAVRKGELVIRTDQMISQLAKTQRLDALFTAAANDIQRVMDDATATAGKVAQAIAKALYPSPDTQQQLLFEMRVQSAWQRAMRALEKQVSPYEIIQQAGDQSDRVMMAALLRELPAYCALGNTSAARRERENLVDAISKISRTMLTPSERDAAGINEEVVTGMSQLRTSTQLALQEVQSQRGASLYSGQGYRTAGLTGWSKGFYFKLDNNTDLAQIEAEDMAKLS